MFPRLLSLLLCMACISANAASVLSCFEGSTSEESCGGTGLKVCLSGNQIREMDWTMETSQKFIRRQYSFTEGNPSSVIETIYRRLDSHGNAYAKPPLQSVRKYRLNVSNAAGKQAELLEHAQFLIQDFQKNRREFKVVNF